MTKTDELLAADLAVLQEGIRETIAASLKGWGLGDIPVSLPGYLASAVVNGHIRRLHERLSAPRAYAEGVVVKALEWLDLAYADDRFWQTHHGYGSYTISIGGEVGYEFVLRPIGQGFPSLDAAKAAAQADFEARIRSALSVPEQAKEPGEGVVLVDDAADAATLRGFIKEFGMTPSMMASQVDILETRARHVIAAEAEFRAQMPAGFDGDPLTDAVADLASALAASPSSAPTLAAASSAPPEKAKEDTLPADVVELVISAREVAYTSQPASEDLERLEKASWVFADRVPWDEEPEPAAETCQRCRGNGEIVTDWGRYLHEHEGDDGGEAVTECPDCSGSGEAGE